MTEGGRVEERVMSVYERLGEPLILTGGASSRPVRAIVGVMSTSFRNARFTSAEYGTCILPPPESRPPIRRSGTLSIGGSECRSLQMHLFPKMRT